MLRVPWTAEMDAAIPASLEYARNNEAPEYTDANARRKDLFNHAIAWLEKQFPKTLRGRLTRYSLYQRIRILNGKKRQRDDDYIFVTIPPWVVEKKPARSEESQVPDVHPESLPVPPPVTSSLDATVAMLVTGQRDVNALLALQVEEMVKSREQMNALTNAFTHLSDTLTALAETKKKPQPAPISTTLQVHSGPKRPKEPSRADPYVFARRENMCFGPEWELLKDQPLTADEQEWQLVNSYRLSHRQGGLVKVSTFDIIIFGWFGTVARFQNVFHRLNPDTIYWIPTYDQGKRALIQSNRISRKHGQLVLMNSYLGHANPDAHSDAIRQCKLHRLPYIRMCGHNVETDQVAHHLLTTIYRSEWLEFQHRREAAASRVAQTQNGTTP